MLSESVIAFGRSQLNLLVEKRGKEKRFSTKTKFIENLKPAASFCMNIDSRYMTKLLSWNHCTKTSDRRRCREIAKFLRYEQSTMHCFLWSQLSSLVQIRDKEKLLSTKTRFIETLNLLRRRRQWLLHSRLWSHRN